MIQIKFAENLRELRKNAGLTQKQLASVMGVDQRTVSAWEKGVCEPSFQMLATLCDVFNETLNDILT